MDIIIDENTHNNQSKLETIPTNKRTRLITFLILFILGIIIVLGIFFVGFYIGRNQSKNQNINSLTQVITTPQATVVNTLENTANTNPTASPISDFILPEIIERKPNSNIGSWSFFEDARGYSFYYPPGWYIPNSYDKTVSTIQNWDPKKVINPGIPMSDNNSKWDIGFLLENFTSLKDIYLTRINKNPDEDLILNKIEKSKTKDGLEIYFVEGTFANWGDKDSRKQFLDAVVVLDKTFYTWSGFPSANSDDAEVLKQMVESISMIK